MSSTGRRSTGCQTCRNRRIKCDEQKPICHRCRKAKRVCYGYPDQSDIIFRDQNHLAKKHALENKTAFTPRSHQNPGLLIGSFSVDPNDAVLNQLSCSSYLTGGNKEVLQSIPALIPSLYASARSDSPCAPAILATAWLISAPFATLGQRMGAARRNYGQSVVKLQNALQDPRTAKADDALFTVLLMLMLENMTATSKSMPNPGQHIKGAVMLVNLRGSQNFASDTAKNMFSFVKSTLMALPAGHKLGCISFSDEVIEADRSICARCDSPTLSTRLENIAFAISILRGKLDGADLKRSKPQTMRNISQQSRILDQELMVWRNSVPRDWEAFSVRPYDQEQSSEDGVSASAPTWHGYTASYPDLQIAKLMNHFRMHSIAIQCIDIRCAKWTAQFQSAERPTSVLAVTKNVTTAHDSSKYIKAQNIIGTLVDGICASVPFHLDTLASKGRDKSLGRERSGKPSNHTRSGETSPLASNGTPSVPRDPERPAGTFVLLQPLVVAYTAPGVPADQKKWILGKSLEIARYIGMDEAMVEKMLNSLASG